MSSTRKLQSQKSCSEGFEDVDGYNSPEQTPQQPPLRQPPDQQPPAQQPPNQQTPVLQPLSSHHEDDHQVDNPQQEAIQDDDISYLWSPAGVVAFGHFSSHLMPSPDSPCDISCDITVDYVRRYMTNTTTFACTPLSVV